jgi:hypothetical protein
MIVTFRPILLIYPAHIHAFLILLLWIDGSCIVVQSYHDDPQFKALFELLCALKVSDAHLRALNGTPTALFSIKSKFHRLIGPVDSFDICRLDVDSDLRGQLRSAVMTVLQAEVVVGSSSSEFQSNLFLLHLHDWND